MGLLYEDLSYKVRGIAINIRKDLGPGHKESLYQNAFAEELIAAKIHFSREKSIAIYSPKTNKKIGSYRPDFIIADKILLEVKAMTNLPEYSVDQLYSYLRNSVFELGFLINFSGPKLYIKRIIWTNDNKPFLNKQNDSRLIRT